MFLGIDIGTSAVKALVIDDDGSVAAHSTSALQASRPQPLWSEQDPEHWWQATDAAVRDINAGLRERIRGIGLTGQMHGATLLDDSDRPLRPAILWNDGRASEECAELEARVPAARDITGNLAMPGFTAPKLLWVRHHEPAVFSKLRTVLLPKDFVRLRMSGEKVSDMSDAAGTYWLDVRARRWSGPLLEACGLNTGHMPRLVEGSVQGGTLRAEVASAWGMRTVPLAGGAGDNAAGAIGVGGVAPGDALLSLGTSGVIFVVTDAFRPNSAQAVHAFCHCLPGLWHQMAVHLSAAVCVDWVGRLLGALTPAAVFASAERADPGPELFLPYLSGERTPHNDPLVRGAFLGLDHDTTSERLALAVLEGVALTLADGLDAIRDAGTVVDRLAVIGGGARSLFWGRLLSAALGVHLEYLAGGEVGPALGAARLAQLAVDHVSVASVCGRPATIATITPDPTLRARLAVKRMRFRDAYHRITPRNHS